MAGESLRQREESLAGSPVTDYEDKIRGSEIIVYHIDTTAEIAVNG